MSSVGMPRWSLRLEQAEYSRLFRALAISLALHILVFGTWYTGNKLQWWQHWQWPSWMHSAPMLTEILKKKTSTDQAKERQTQVPLMFVDVSQASAEAPPKADFYSDKNSRAANPDTTKDTAVPKIEGAQTQIVKTEDVPMVKTSTLQPTPPSVEIAKDAREEEQAKPADPPGDLALAKPNPTPKPDQGEAKRTKPRTIKEALAQQPNLLAGKKMKQDGGVRRRSVTSSLDAIATPFGAYDAAIVAAVQNRWYDLLGERQFAGESAGKVTLKFQLSSSGGISEMKLVESTVDYTLALICQTAINEPAPYGPWPTEMRRLIGSDSREVTFTFFYY